MVFVSIFFLLFVFVVVVIVLCLFFATPFSYLSTLHLHLSVLVFVFNVSFCELLFTFCTNICSTFLLLLLFFYLIRFVFLLIFFYFSLAFVCNSQQKQFPIDFLLLVLVNLHEPKKAAVFCFHLKKHKRDNENKTLAFGNWFFSSNS